MNRHGNAYIEYFVLALIVALATIAFWRGGFVRARGSVESAFDASVNRILAP
jgi:Flp pilus assembly pilin Flp